VGVTSQKEELRKKFPGTPEHVVNFFEFVAEEVRELLAHLGYKSLDDIIGRADLLQTSKSQVERVAKTKGIDLDKFFSGVPSSVSDRSFLKATMAGGVQVPKEEIVHINGFSSDLDREVCANADIEKIIRDNAGEVVVTYPIKNTDRSTGAMLAGNIARAHGNSGFKGQINVQFEGSAGQSFGAFSLPGLSLKLVGEGNDYVGKGMHGGDIVVVPSPDAGFVAADSSIIGNACLYGATGGDFHANGRAGERFCVRNSGAFAVAEGAGDHCCEYMTGGVVVMLGSVGRNVGAGMTGGIGYFYDKDGDFQEKVNPEIVSVQRLKTSEGEAQLKHMVERHFELTGSERADEILGDWENEKAKFWQVYPPSESKTAVVSENAEPSFLRVSASAPDGEYCFLPVGAEMSPEQTQRCAD
jgi:glutamate synthase (ferredoxin)